MKKLPIDMYNVEPNASMLRRAFHRYYYTRE